MINSSETLLILSVAVSYKCIQFLYLIMSCFVNYVPTCSFSKFGSNQIPRKNDCLVTEYVMDLSKRTTHEHLEKYKTILIWSNLFSLPNILSCPFVSFLFKTVVSFVLSFSYACFCFCSSLLSFVQSIRMHELLNIR